VEGAQEMIVNEVSRELAALVSVASLTMVAIAVSILRHYWDRFEDHRLRLSRSVWKTTCRVGLIISLCLIVLLVVYAFFRIRKPDYASVMWMPLLFGLLFLPSLLVLIDFNIRRKIKKQIVGKLEPHTLFYFIALSSMAVSIVSNIIALLGVAPAMLSITVGPFDPGGFEWAKWSLVIGIIGFSLSIIYFGIAFVLDKAEQWKNKLPKEKQK